jgi:hypothetical protein
VGQFLSSALMGFYLSTGFCLIPALQVQMTTGSHAYTWQRV